jgi:hypothetical protein
VCGGGETLNSFAMCVVLISVTIILYPISSCSPVHDFGIQGYSHAIKYCGCDERS